VVKSYRDLRIQKFMLDVKRGDLSAVRYDLDHRDSDANATSSDGWPALIVAVWSGNSDLVESLIDHGADVNVKHSTGMTALMTAAEYGRSDIAKLLLVHGAEVSATCSNGMSALVVAAYFGNADVVNLLLTARADTVGRMADGAKAAEMACKGYKGASPCAKADILKALAKSAKDNGGS